MNNFQVKWSKELVGKKVYNCSASHMWNCPTVLCEAVVTSVTGKRAVVKPSNFAVADEKDSLHKVSSRELWYTFPRAAVLARLKEIYECIAKSIHEDRVDRIFCEKVYEGDQEQDDLGEYKKKKLDGRRDPGFVIKRHMNNAYNYEEALQLAQRMERFECYPCDYQYQNVGAGLEAYWSGAYEELSFGRIYDKDPLTVFALDKRDFRKSVSNIKSYYGEDITACFEETDDGKYKVKLLSVYQFLKAKGRIELPIVTKECLWSVSVAKISGQGRRKENED